MVTSLDYVREKLRTNKLVLSAQLLVPGYREPAHVLRWGKSGLTICGERAAKTSDLGRANHICGACWDVVEWSMRKQKPNCARCAYEFKFFEKPSTLCEYCEHVRVSQFGADR